MATYRNERALLSAVRERLDGWIYEGREAAFETFFEGPDAALTEEDLATLDRIDSRLAREGDVGLWGADDYGIIATGTLDEETTPRVVCTNHPQVPESAYPAVDDATRDRLNEALWEYAELVAAEAQTRLEEFVRSVAVESWEG